MSIESDFDKAVQEGSRFYSDRHFKLHQQVLRNMIKESMNKEMNVREAMLYCYDNPKRVVVNKRNPQRKYLYNGHTFMFYNNLDCRWQSEIDVQILDSTCTDLFVREEDLEKPLKWEDGQILAWVQQNTVPYNCNRKLIDVDEFETYLRERNK